MYRNLITLLLIQFIFIGCKKNSPNNDNEIIFDILYTDIDPDSTVVAPTVSDSFSYYYFDLNNDEIDDFRFGLRHWYTFVSPSCCDNYYNKIESLNNNKITGDESTFGHCAQPLFVNDTIDNCLYWATSSTLLAKVEFSNLCPWDWPDRFIGLKLVVSNDTLYGWIRLNADYSEILIKEYAINKASNMPIIAGQIE